MDWLCGAQCTHTFPVNVIRRCPRQIAHWNDWELWLENASHWIKAGVRNPPRLINSSWIANSCVSDALPIYTAEMMIRDVTEVCIFLLSGTIWWQQQHKCRCHLFAAGRCFSALKPHTHTHTPRTFLTPKSYFCFKLITASCVFSFKFICHITKLEPTDVY